jgi:hypothetical protein
MKAYIVTLLNLPESVEIAKRAYESANCFGLEATLRPGVWRDEAMQELTAEGLVKGTFDETWSNTPAAMGNFVAQLRIWREIAHGEGGIIMEHDSVVVAPIPDLTGKGEIINLGKPSFGKLRNPRYPGFYPLFSTGDKIPGAHGYYLTPGGAQLLIHMAKRKGAIPVDKFISPQRFVIAEYFPWPIVAVEEHQMPADEGLVEELLIHRQPLGCGQITGRATRSEQHQGHQPQAAQQR